MLYESRFFLRLPDGGHRVWRGSREKINYLQLLLLSSKKMIGEYLERFAPFMEADFMFIFIRDNGGPLFGVLNRLSAASENSTYTMASDELWHKFYRVHLRWVRKACQGLHSSFKDATRTKIGVGREMGEYPTWYWTPSTRYTKTNIGIVECSRWQHNVTPFTNPR